MRAMCAEGWFSFTKFLSNSKVIFSSIPEEEKTVSGSGIKTSNLTKS